MSSFVELLQQSLNESELTPCEVEGMPTVYFRPLTLLQAKQIDSETNTWVRIARHFQVRAKDANGNPLVKPAEFDDFLKFAPQEKITAAVSIMQGLETNNTAEEAEKNS